MYRPQNLPQFTTFFQNVSNRVKIRAHHFFGFCFYPIGIKNLKIGVRPNRVYLFTRFRSSEIALIPGLGVFILPMLIVFSLLRIAKNVVFLIFLRNIRPVLYGLKAKIFSLLAMICAFAPIFSLLYDRKVALEFLIFIIKIISNSRILK